MYSLIGGLSAVIMVIAAICNPNNEILFFDILKNLGFGCVASTIVALLIEIGNVKEKNEKANNVYCAVYADLQHQIMWYIKTWARLCGVAFKNEDYDNQKHTWIEWYEITKKNFAECDASRQAELFAFFKDELLFSIDRIERTLKLIDQQQYILNISGIYDEELKNILNNYSFEFYAARLSLDERNDSEYFWNSFDAIKDDLEKYIYNWVDIRYYNYCKLGTKLFVDKEEIAYAIIESEKTT